MRLNKEVKTKIREESIQKWKLGKGIDPSLEEVNAFETGFNMAWKYKPTRMMLDGSATLAYIKGLVGK